MVVWKVNQEMASWIPKSVLDSKGVRIEDAGSSKEVAEWVRQGKAFLKVVETPWGIEFYICEVAKGE